LTSLGGAPFAFPTSRLRSDAHRSELRRGWPPRLPAVALAEAGAQSNLAFDQVDRRSMKNP
jgi:hypothetical protein